MLKLWVGGKLVEVDPTEVLVPAPIGPDTPMSSVTARYRRFLISGDYSDITLLVGKGRTPIMAHKMILIFGSPYFEEKLVTKNVNLQSNIAEAGRVVELESQKTKTASSPPQCYPSETLLIENVEPDEFKLFLKFIYGGMASIKVDEAMPLLICGTQFKVPSLVKACDEVINRAVDLESALSLFKQALHYSRVDLPLNRTIDLVETAAEFILKNAYKVVDREEFSQLQVGGILSLLESDDLEVYDEMQLFEAVLKWVKTECKRQKLDPASPKCLRSVLEPVLKFIRFPQMKPSEFALKVPRLKILTSDEVVDILPYFHVSQIQRASLPSEFFISRTRNYHTPYSFVNIVKRLDLQSGGSGSFGSQSYPCGSSTHLKLKANKCVWIKSIGLSPSTSNSGSYGFGYNSGQRLQMNMALKLSVKAEIRNPEDEELCYGSVQDIVSPPSSNTSLHVEFKNSVRMNPGVWYMIVVSIEVQQGEYRAYAYTSISGGKIQCETGVTFEFQNIDEVAQQGRQLPELGYQLDD